MFRNTDKITEGAALSARERDILDLLSQGLSNKEIGVRLNISPCTVKNHLARVFEKMQVRCRTAAALAYFQSVTGSAAVAPLPSGASRS